MKRIWTDRLLKRAYRAVSVAAVGALALTITLAGYFLVTSPVAFQKSAAIRFVDQPDWQLPVDPSPIAIDETLAAIPYQQPAGMVYEVAPKAKHRRTIEQGDGNCSNLAFGLAYQLDRDDRPYQIVHLMPPVDFLRGEGHTVVNMPYQFNGQPQEGIVDLLEGGLPTTDGEPLTLADLRRGHLTGGAIVPLNGRHDTDSPYYGEFLDRSVVGVIDPHDVANYFAFLETVYIPLGNARLEKLTYDGAALVLGYYPTIEVAAADRTRLFAGVEPTRMLALMLLYSTRGLLVIVAVWGGLFVVKCLRIWVFVARGTREPSALAAGISSAD